MTIKSKKTTCRKLLSFILVFLLTLMIAIPASVGTKVMAADVYSITIKNSEHLADMVDGQFKAYQIFSGNINPDDLSAGVHTSRALADIVWGKNINGPGLLEKLKGTPGVPLTGKFTSCTTPEDVARVLDENEGNKFLQAFAKLINDEKLLKEADAASSTTSDGQTSVIDNLAPGYYMILDTVNNAGGESAPGKVVSEFILAVTGNQTINIKADIPTVNKEITSGGHGKGSSATVGDTVSFKITGTLPSNYGDYEKYQHTITDTLSKGLTYVENTLDVQVGETKHYKATDLKALSSDNFEYKTEKMPDGSTKITISFIDLKAFAVEERITDLTGDDDIIVTYSANINSEAVITKPNTNEVYIEYSTNPDDPNGGELGKTTTDTNNVYNFGLDITKVGSNATSTGLQGAEFILQRNSDSDYATFDDTINGKVNGWVNSESGAKKVTSDASGHIDIDGLAEGSYVLKEVKAPKGYNTMADIKFTITATYGTDGSVSTLTFTDTDGRTAEITGISESAENIKDNTISVTFVDEKAPLLPFTGGMGTYIFYALGGILLAGAAIYIVCTRFRKQNR